MEQLNEIARHAREQRDIEGESVKLPEGDTSSMLKESANAGRHSGPQPVPMMK
jgi:hypothetical protein